MQPAEACPHAGPHLKWAEKGMRISGVTWAVSHILLYASRTWSDPRSDVFFIAAMNCSKGHSMLVSLASCGGLTHGHACGIRQVASYWCSYWCSW
jgi:hypothetical protein